MEEDLFSKIPEDAFVILTGLPGTGKSYFAKTLCEVKNFILLRSDMIRAELFKGIDLFDERFASDEERREAVYEEMFERAKRIVGQKKFGIILDGTFYSNRLRLKAAQIALLSKKDFVIVECRASEKKALERIKGRKDKAYESNAVTEEAYRNNLRIFESVDLKQIKRIFPTLSILYIRINTEEDNKWKVERIEKI